MPYNTNSLLKDARNLPIPQYYNGNTDQNEPLQGSNGAQYVQPVGSNSIKGARQVVVSAGMRVNLPNYPCREITIIGLSSNTGSIYVGGNDVSFSAFGVELSAKDSITLTVSNTNLIWIDAAVSGEGVSYVAI
jgi:hypothetical protein